MHTSHASQSGDGAEFAMNPNTGALIPLTKNAPPGGGKGDGQRGTPAAQGGSQGGLPSPHSLLGTPALVHSSVMLDRQRLSSGRGAKKNKFVYFTACFVLCQAERIWEKLRPPVII